MEKVFFEIQANQKFMKVIFEIIRKVVLGIWRQKTMNIMDHSRIIKSVEKGW
jgi:hypothetical protein